MHINFKANSNYLLLQFLYFHSLLFSYFKECTQITSVGNLQLLNAFQNRLYGPLLYLPILFWIFKRKHYYHFNNPSKRPSAIFSRLDIHSPKSFYPYPRPDLFQDFFVIKVFRPCSAEAKLSIKQLQTE